MRKEFYSNGKLLITGEYAVLDGAKAFAIPTKYGQSLIVTSNTSNKIDWTSLDEKGNIWFKATYELDNLVEISSNNSDISETLREILVEVQALNPHFLKNSSGYNVVTKLTFPREWGLGTSSTLINNIAQWANINPFALLKTTLGGSGYDIGCAQHNKPIIFENKNGLPTSQEVKYSPTLTKTLYFVYLNKKQNSRDAIKKYNSEKINRKKLAATISQITQEMVTSTSINNFELLMTKHETEISNALRTPTIKSKLFADYPRAIKSLGAWGGDFIMVTGDESLMDYFRQKGYNTIIPYTEMIL